MSSKIEKFKVIFHYVGILLAICGVVFVIVRLHHYWQDIDFSRISLYAWIFISVLVGCYALINVFLALAWKWILSYFEVKAGSGWAIRSYGISQLAKYVPGNIFHIAGRQALAMATGMAGKPVLKANILELTILSMLGGLSVWIACSVMFPAFSLPFATVCLTTCIAGIIYCAKKYMGDALAKAIIYQLLFLVLSATIFASVVSILAPAKSFSFTTGVSIGGVYTLAWLAGLVIPGAPAGIGIRELVIVYFLHKNIPESDLLLAVLLGRIVTVGGDIVFFIVACIFEKRLKGNKGFR